MRMLGSREALSRYVGRRLPLTALIAVSVIGVGLLLGITRRHQTDAVPAPAQNHPVFAPRPIDRDGRWTKAQLSLARTALAATAVGGKALFAGGCAASAAAASRTCGGGGSVVDIVDVYDSSSDSWSTGRLSVPRRDLAATSAGTKAFSRVAGPVLGRSALW